MGGKRARILEWLSTGICAGAKQELAQLTIHQISEFFRKIARYRRQEKHHRSRRRKHGGGARRKQLEEQVNSAVPIDY